MALGTITRSTLLTAAVVLSLVKSVEAQTRESNRPATTPDSSAPQSKTGSVDRKVVTGWVVAMDGPDVVIDLGSTQGLHSGDVVEIWRPVRLKHPVTGKVITDRFLTGDLTLNQVRSNLSWARPAGTLERPVAIGDIVQRTVNAEVSKGSETVGVAAMPTENQPANGPPAQRTASAQPEPNAAVPGDNDALQVARLFESMQGRSPLERAMHYENYVRSHRTRFARTLLEEAALLRAQSSSVYEAAAETGVVHQVTIPDNQREVVDGLYLAILSRFPTDEERETVRVYAQSGNAGRRQAAMDVAWALINSAEFLYRH